MFRALGTQWRCVAGLGGVAYAGLDYAGVRAVIDLKGIPEAERWALFEDIRAMEGEALVHLNARRNG